MDPERREHLIGYGLALGAAAAVGFTPVASKVLLRELHVVPFGMVWFACAGTYATLALLVRGRIGDMRLRGRVFAAAASVGISNALAGLLFFRAVQLTDPALVAFFSRPGTILLVLAGVVVFRERLTRLEWIAVLVVIGGSLVMGATSSTLQLRAFVLVVLSTVMTSVSYALAKGAVASARPLVLVAYRAWFTSGTLAVICVATDAWEFPVGSYLWAMPLGAFAGPFLSFALLFAAFERLAMSRASVVHAIYPLFTTVYGLLLLSVDMTAVQFFGGLLATAGIAMLIAARPAAATGAGDPKGE